MACLLPFAFVRDMISAGALPSNVDYKMAYTLQFMKDL